MNLYDEYSFFVNFKILVTIKYCVKNKMNFCILLYNFLFIFGLVLKKSIVDDEFFKLSEMENFLLSEEKSEAAKEKSKRLEDEIDMFQDLQSDDEVYNNFFDLILKFKKLLVVKLFCCYFYHLIF